LGQIVKVQFFGKSGKTLLSSLFSDPHTSEAFKFFLFIFFEEQWKKIFMKRICSIIPASKQSNLIQILLQNDQNNKYLPFLSHF